MGTLTPTQRSELRNVFGPRVTFDPTECRLYSHDVTPLPRFLRRAVGSTVPDAVVQPQSTEEIAVLVRWAMANDVPLTPRGRATSGYGGVVPVRQGVVVDFYRMSRILEVYGEARTATVQAGVVWQTLDHELARHDLTLRLYPTSYPGSTVGGWLAQDGAGLGSYEAGWFRDNVLSARVVLLDGTAWELCDKDLELVAGAEGTTGLIADLTLRVRPFQDTHVIGVGCPDGHALEHLVYLVVAERIPLWSVSFLSPRMAELLNQAPLARPVGATGGERALLPQAHVATLAFSPIHRDTVEASLPDLLGPCQAERLPDETTRQLWARRFDHLGIKRLAPSLVPAHLVVPLPVLGDVLNAVQLRLGRPVPALGTVVRAGGTGAPEVVLRSFIPSDERKFRYDLHFSLARDVVEAAEDYGGRPYGIGLHFARKLTKALGTARAGRLRAFKRQEDPKGLLNPGKVFENARLTAAFRLMEGLGPIVRPLGKLLGVRMGERPGRGARGISAATAWHAYSCVQCGHCLETCDQFLGRGWESQSPRGRWFWLREFLGGRAAWNALITDAMLACTTCQLCDLSCPAGLPSEATWMSLRGKLVGERGRMTIPLLELLAASVDKRGNIWLARRSNRGAWFPSDLAERHGPAQGAKTLYMAGCTASFVEEDVAIATARLLDAARVPFRVLGEAEPCCGMPLLVAGKWGRFAELVKSNVEALNDLGVETVITSCPSCDWMWRHVYPKWANDLRVDYGVTARHYTEVLAERIEAGDLRFPDDGREPLTVTWHDSCHLGRGAGIYDAPRRIIRAIPNTTLVEMGHSRQDARCCGNFITLFKEPAVATNIARRRLDEAVASGAETLLSACPACQFQFRVAAGRQTPISIMDLARFAAAAFGHKFPAPGRYVARHWALFERLIALLTPQGIAKEVRSSCAQFVGSVSPVWRTLIWLMARLPWLRERVEPLYIRRLQARLPALVAEAAPAALDRVAAEAGLSKRKAKEIRELLLEALVALVPHMTGDIVGLLTETLRDQLGQRAGPQRRNR